MSVPIDYEDGPHSTGFRSNSGGHGRGDLPEGCHLSDTTDRELLDLIEIEGRQR